MARSGLRRGERQFDHLMNVDSYCLSRANFASSGVRLTIPWSALSDIDDRPDSRTNENKHTETNEESETLFVSYAPAKLRGGKPHPAVIVESSSMAAVTPPDITHRPHLAPEIVSEGRLSDVQLEHVIYAGQRHEQRLRDGSRAGFFVGDGTGVGKGRILAGIIADNFNQGRERALWLSVNNDLLEATRRDLTDLGLGRSSRKASKRN